MSKGSTRAFLGSALLYKFRTASKDVVCGFSVIATDRSSGGEGRRQAGCMLKARLNGDTNKHADNVGLISTEADSPGIRVQLHSILGDVLAYRLPS